MTRCLVVVEHPRPDSLTRAALERVLAGLDAAGHEVRLIDLDNEQFDPRLTAFEQQHHIGDPNDRPYLADHADALRWAQRIVLVYPTWFSGQPARLKGWIDRTWMHQVAFELPADSSRIRAKLWNVRRLDIVTSHGSSRLVNLVQGNGGRLIVFRTLRLLCHPLCRTSFTAIYKIDRQAPEACTEWLDRVERRFAR
ncbi:MAG: NAD(P)H-dependent oxidoreductase [Acidimicrobiales bacterium]